MVSGAGADGVAAGATGCPVEEDVAAVCSRLAPTHMPPDGREGQSKVAGSCTPGALQRRAYVYTRPANTAVGRAVHHVLARGQAATALVHRCHVNPATALQVAGNLYVADETGVELVDVHRPMPWPPQPVAKSPANHMPKRALYTTIGSQKLVPWPEQRGWLACQVAPLSVE